MSITGVGLENGLGTLGLKRAPLNLTMKKKQPRKTPWGEDPGRDLTVCRVKKRLHNWHEPVTEKRLVDLLKN